MCRILFRIFFLALFALSIVGIVGGSIISAYSPTIEVLHVEGTIVPVVKDYLERGINHAEDENATVCIIELNTPGGVLDTTDKMVSKIMNAKVPIVVYVSPVNAWAASAGTFITLSAHIAAMTPGTTIGAAHPVAGGGQEIPEDYKKKITEFSAKWMETIAEERGRNIEEARLAVTESKSFTDVEALEYNLIDLRADSLESLISQINGWKVTLANGAEVTIDTTGYKPGDENKNEMNAIEKFLQVISDPNIAYLLFTLATIGIITEVSNPGMIFPGVIGGISLFLAFYSLGVLHANYAGIALILLAMGLFIAEYFTTTFGLLTVGGVVSLVMGSLILFTGSEVGEVNRGLIAGVTAAITAFSIFVIGAIIRGQRRRKATGAEGMIGSVAIVKTPLAPTGTVLAQGELWTATTEKDRIDRGEEVIISKVEELKLWVKRKSKK